MLWHIVFCSERNYFWQYSPTELNTCAAVAYSTQHRPTAPASSTCWQHLPAPAQSTSTCHHPLLQQHLQTAPTSSSTCQRHLPTAPANGTLPAALGSSTWQQHLLAAHSSSTCQQHLRRHPVRAPVNSNCFFQQICPDTWLEHLPTAPANSTRVGDPQPKSSPTETHSFGSKNPYSFQPSGEWGCLNCFPEAGKKILYFKCRFNKTNGLDKLTLMVVMLSCHMGEPFIPTGWTCQTSWNPVIQTGRPKQQTIIGFNPSQNKCPSPWLFTPNLRDPHLCM